MNIAITGHTGFIGRQLVRRFQQDGINPILVSRFCEHVDCDRIYHLACPSTTEFINKNPTKIIDIITDGTRSALSINSRALFVNASSLGAVEQQGGAQQCYNTAKRCMELYIEHSGRKYVNYRLPSVYGEGMNADNFIMRCINGTAYYPQNPEQEYHIAHVDDVVDAMVQLIAIPTETLTLGEIYEQFNTGGRRLHRPTPVPSTTAISQSTCYSNR